MIGAIARGSVGAVADANGWVRPADWPALPTIESSTQRIVALIAVTNDASNYVALLARGAYTVDWGDGSVVNYADNVRAEHQYTYSTLSSSVTACGYKTALISITPQAGVNLTTLNLNQAHSANRTIPRLVGCISRMHWAVINGFLLRPSRGTPEG